VNNDGFTATYFCGAAAPPPPPDPCPAGGLALTDGTAISYMGGHGNGEDCQWTLTCTTDSPQVSFSFLNTEANFDFVNYYDGADVSAVRVNRMSGDLSASAYAYVGCFRDNEGGRDMTGTGSQNAGASTPIENANNCATLCAGFSYFGLQWVNECFCDNGYNNGNGNNGNQGNCPGGECPITDCDADGAIDADGTADLCANGQGNCGNRNAVYAIGGPTFTSSGSVAVLQFTSDGSVTRSPGPLEALLLRRPGPGSGAGRVRRPDRDHRRRHRVRAKHSDGLRRGPRQRRGLPVDHDLRRREHDAGCHLPHLQHRD